MDWKVEAFLKYNGKRTKFVDGKFSGTVFSGHPTRTTLGNTLRVILYFRFMLHESGVPPDRYALYVGGDDSFLLLDP